METQTLADLRENSKLKLYEIIELAREVDPTFPQTHEALIQIEKRGTTDIWRLQALSSVYGLTLDEIAKIAKPESRKTKKVT